MIRDLAKPVSILLIGGPYGTQAIILKNPSQGRPDGFPMRPGNLSKLPALSGMLLYERFTTKIDLSPKPLPGPISKPLYNEFPVTSPSLTPEALDPETPNRFAKDLALRTWETMLN